MPLGKELINKVIICDIGEGKGRAGDSLVFSVTQVRLEPGTPRRCSHRGRWLQEAAGTSQVLTEAYYEWVTSEG